MPGGEGEEESRPTGGGEIVLAPEAADLVPPSLIDRAVENAAHARADSTRDVYRRVFAHFEAWCADKHLSSLPADPAAVILYMAERDRQGLSPASIDQDLAAIAAAHSEQGLPSPRKHPRVLQQRAGIRRRRGAAPRRRKTPLLPDQLRAIVEALPDDLGGQRDRALLLVGFAGAFRRSELVALQVEDLEMVEEGMRITIRRSKTDQEGQGAFVGIPFGEHEETCPVRALAAWLEASGVTTGPLFRAVNRHGRVGERALSGVSVGLIVKKAVGLSGLDPAYFGGHSLRSGLCTAAAIAGKGLPDIMRQSRHRSLATLLGYIRKATVFRDNAAKGLL